MPRILSLAEWNQAKHPRARSERANREFDKQIRAMSYATGLDRNQSINILRWRGKHKTVAKPKLDMSLCDNAQSSALARKVGKPTPEDIIAYVTNGPVNGWRDFEAHDGIHVASIGVLMTPADWATQNVEAVND